MSTLTAPRQAVPVGTAPCWRPGCGTAVASVCGVRPVPDRADARRRLVRGGGCWRRACAASAWARACARLTAVVPSGAGLLAFLSRGLGAARPGWSSVPAVLMLTLFLAGAEAVIVGTLLSRLLPIPMGAGAVLFLVGTWAVCRGGVRVGTGRRRFATWALMGRPRRPVAAVRGRVGGAAGDLAARLLPPVRGRPGHFVAASGRRCFCSWGFQLITSQAKIAEDRERQAGARRSVILLGRSTAPCPARLLVSGGRRRNGGADVARAGHRRAGRRPARAATRHDRRVVPGLLHVVQRRALLTRRRLVAALAAQGVLRGGWRASTRALVPRPPSTCC